MNVLSKLTLAVILIVFATNACDETQNDNGEGDFQLRWEVVSNFLDNNNTRNELVLVNESGRMLEDDWTLFFNYMRLIDTESLPDHIEISHVNGDFYRLTPGEAYEPLASGDQMSFTFEAAGSAIMEIDGPDGAYFEFADGTITPVPITTEPFEREEQLHRSPDDVIPVATPEVLYEKNASLSMMSPDQLGAIVPSPKRVDKQSGSFTLTPETPVVYQDGLEDEARYLSESLDPLLGARPAVRGEDETSEEHAIRLEVDQINVDGREKQVGDEAYRLDVTGSGVTITGSDPAGVFYGVQSLRSLLPVDAWQSGSDSMPVEAITIEDAPGFAYRGLHLDVSRNFQSMETVKRLLDAMAYYKLNKFHFHLTDDEGWRLAIEAFPELTEIGGRRGHTLDESEHLVPSYGSGPFPDSEVSMGSGWYSRDDYVEILQYAAERHIEIIPEIDMPGHARAALVAMKNRYERLLEENREEEAERYRIHEPEDTSEYMSIQRWDDNVINVCQESSFRFLGEVYDEIISMHEEAGAPLNSIHLGGDEVPHGVWVDSPACDQLIAESEDVQSADDLMNYFFARSESDLSGRGLTMAAWEEFSLIEDPQTDETVPNPMFAGESIPYVWSNIWGTGTEDYSYKLANAGYEILMNHASNFYFDFSYHKHPEETGMYWGGFVDVPDPYSFIPYDLYKSGVTDFMGRPIPEDAYDDYEQLTDEGRDNILGLQAQLWSETFRSPDRVEYMALPRIISLAERAWGPEQEWMEIEDREERLEARSVAWNEFANRLGQRELPRLDGMNGGYGYRIPPPGAIIEDGRVHANVAHPGMAIRYTTDGSEPTVNSSLYERPVDLEGGTEVNLRTFDRQGRGSRVSTVNN